MPIVSEIGKVAGALAIVGGLLFKATMFLPIAAGPLIAGGVLLTAFSFAIDFQAEY